MGSLQDLFMSIDILNIMNSSLKHLVTLFQCDGQLKNVQKPHFYFAYSF